MAGEEGGCSAKPRPRRAEQVRNWKPVHLGDAEIQWLCRVGVGGQNQIHRGGKCNVTEAKVKMESRGTQAAVSTAKRLSKIHSGKDPQMTRSFQCSTRAKEQKVSCKTADSKQRRQKQMKAVNGLLSHQKVR